MKDKMTIIFFSGSYDKAMAMLIMASTGAAMGMDVHIFFTFWGLSFIKKGNTYKNKSLIMRVFEFLMPKNREAMPLDTMNMGGAGLAIMKKLMKQNGMSSMDELLKMCKLLGVKFYGCSTSCSVMGMSRENMIEEVDDIVGASTFFEMAKNAKINLFI